MARFRTLAAGLATLATVWWLATAPLARADPFTEGLAAYDAGDYPVSVRIWSDLAEQGDPVARVALAGLYRSGEGVVRNLETALALYRRAADQGNDNAQLNLGRMYAEGAGVRRDPVQGYVWLSLAAVQGRGWAERRRTSLRAGMSAAQRAAAEAQIAAFRPQ